MRNTQIGKDIKIRPGSQISKRVRKKIRMHTKKGKNLRVSARYAKSLSSQMKTKYLPWEPATMSFTLSAWKSGLRAVLRTNSCLFYAPRQVAEVLSHCLIWKNSFQLSSLKDVRGSNGRKYSCRTQAWRNVHLRTAITCLSKAIRISHTGFAQYAAKNIALIAANSTIMSKPAKKLRKHKK